MKNILITIDNLSENKQFHQWNHIGHDTISNQWKVPLQPQFFLQQPSKICENVLNETQFGLVLLKIVDIHR